MNTSIEVTETQLRIADRDIRVRRLVVGQIAAIGVAWSKLLRRLRADATMFELLAEGGDEAIEAVAIATKTDKQWISELMPTDFTRLALAVWEMNEPPLRAIMPQLAYTMGLLRTAESTTQAAPGSTEVAPAAVTTHEAVLE